VYPRGVSHVWQTKGLKPCPDPVGVNAERRGLDGLQATRQIRETTPNTEVVILTIHESDQMVRRVLDAGALGYLLKSDLATHLVKAVKNVSAGKLFLPQSI
jgi:DNA-binding NarL/FixJ family response regulator